MFSQLLCILCSRDGQIYINCVLRTNSTSDRRCRQFRLKCRLRNASTLAEMCVDGDGSLCFRPIEQNRADPGLGDDIVGIVEMFVCKCLRNVAGTAGFGGAQSVAL